MSGLDKHSRPIDNKQPVARSHGRKDGRASRKFRRDNRPKETEIHFHMPKISKEDRRLIRRNVTLARKLYHVLSLASPRSSQTLISNMAVDLADIWKIGESHRRDVKKLMRMRFPRDREQLRTLLIKDIDLNLLFENQYHLTSLKKCLPKLLKDMNESKHRSKKR